MDDTLLACVVVVDDSEDHRYLARRAVRRARLAEQVIECADGESALRVLLARATSAPEVAEGLTLALIDVNMPRMNGFELLDRLGEGLVDRKAPAPFIVAVSSSSADAVDVERALGHPLVHAYLSKPPVPDALRELVDEQLGLRRGGS